MQAQIPDSLLKSKGAMATIAQYLPLKKQLEMNLISQKFYNEVVPSMFETNHQLPSCNSNYILYIRAGVLYGLKVGAQTNTREIDFEEDLWLHDCHHEFNTTDGSGGNKVVKLLTFSEIRGDD